MSCTKPSDVTTSDSLVSELTSRMPSARASGRVYLQRAMSEFFRRSKRWRDKSQKVTVSAGTTEIPCPNYLGRIVRVLNVYVVDPSDSKNLQPIDEYRGPNFDARAPNIEWECMNNTVVELSQPLQSETTVTFYVALMPARPDFRCDPQLLELYDEAIIQGAMHYATLSQSQETEDLRKTSAHQFEFEKGIKEAKRYAERSRNSGGTQQPISSRVVDLQRHRRPYRQA